MHRLTNRIAVSPLTGDVSRRTCTPSCIFEVLVLTDSAASDTLSIAITILTDACVLCQAGVWCMRDVELWDKLTGSIHTMRGAGLDCEIATA